MKFCFKKLIHSILDVFNVPYYGIIEMSSGSPNCWSEPEMHNVLFRTHRSAEKYIKKYVAKFGNTYNRLCIWTEKVEICPCCNSMTAQGLIKANFCNICKNIADNDL